MLAGAAAAPLVAQQLATPNAKVSDVGCSSDVSAATGTTFTAACDMSGAGGQAAGTVTFSFSGDDGSIDPASVKPT